MSEQPSDRGLMSSFLRPCPHCGAKAELVEFCGDFWIRCTNKCQKMNNNREDVIIKWNDRVIWTFETLNNTVEFNKSEQT